jgi:WD40 repeat protein
VYASGMCSGGNESGASAFVPPSPDSNSASSSSYTAPSPPATNFLLFAGMHRPLLYLYDLRTKRLRAFKSGHISAICCVKVDRSAAAGAPAAPNSAVAAAGRRLAVSGGYDHAACVWDVDTGSLVARLTGGCSKTVWCVDLSGRLVAAGADDGVVRIFKIDPPPGVEEDEDEDLTPAERERMRRAKKLAEMKELFCVKSSSTASSSSQADDQPSRPSRYANDARFNGPPEDPVALATSAPSSPDPQPDPDTGGRLVAELLGHTASPMTVHFDAHASGRLWSAGYDRSIRLWDIASVHRSRPGEPVQHPQCLRVLLGHTSVVFSLIVTPHVLISTSRDGSVRIWDKDVGVELRHLDAGRPNSDLVSAIAAGSGSSDSASLTSSRAQAFDIKCAQRTASGDIVTASSDGRIAIFEFERRGGRVGGHGASLTSPHVKRANSGMSTSLPLATSTTNAQEPAGCAIM